MDKLCSECGTENAWVSGKCSKCYHRTYYHDVRRKQFFDHLGGVCVNCGSGDELEIDHIDRSKKTMNFSDRLSFSRPDVQKELENAQLLCRDCHLEKTISEREPFTHGTMYSWMKVKCDCDACEKAHREYTVLRREKRQAKGLVRGKREGYGRPSNHGEILHYRRGCKCDLCRAANTAYAKSLKK